MSERFDVIRNVKIALHAHEEKLHSLLEDWKHYNSDTLVSLSTMLDKYMQDQGTTVTSATCHGASSTLPLDFELVVPTDRISGEKVPFGLNVIDNGAEQQATNSPGDELERIVKIADKQLGEEDAGSDCIGDESRHPKDDCAELVAPLTPKIEEDLAESTKRPSPITSEIGEDVAEPKVRPSLPRRPSRKDLIEASGNRSNDQLKLTAVGKKIVEASQDHSHRHKTILSYSYRAHFRARFAGEIAVFLKRLETVVGFFIIVNAIYLGVLTESMAQHSAPSEQVVTFVARSFAAIFFLDLFLRILLQGRDFWIGTDRILNWFDVVVVLSTCFDVLGIDQIPQVSILRAVRIFRLLRIIRAIRVFSMFYEFRILIWSVASALRAFFWILCLWILLLYTASLALVDACIPYCHDRVDDDPACEYFGSLGSSMFALYQATMGGLLWGELFQALSPMDLVAKVIFVFFVSIVVLLVLNVYVAVLFDTVHREMQQDSEMAINDELAQKEKFIQDMTDLFDKIDCNDSGAISFDEFQIACGDPRMDAFMSTIKVEVMDLQALFEILDVGGTRTIDKEQFLLGCQRLKGKASAIDVVSLQREVGLLHHYILEIRQHVLPGSQTEVEDAFLAAQPMSEMHHHKSIKSDDVDKRVGSVGSDAQGRNSKYCVIKRSENRAMLLRELRQVCATIRSRCEKEQWANRATGDFLLPEDVDLYQFNTHVICPETVPEGIVLRGLSSAHYSAGDAIMQADAYSRAEGIIMEDSDDGTVQVSVTYGRFIKYQEGRVREILVNTEKRGVPTSVVATNPISYKELISKGPQPSRWYCSHWWGERIFQFVLCCEEHASRRGIMPEDTGYWVCGYANRQYDLEEDICADIKSTAFFKALLISEGVLLVLDGKATPFKRIWCNFEIHQTLIADSKKILDIVMVPRPESDRSDTAHMISDGPLPKENAREKMIRESTFPLNILAEGMKCTLENSSATVELDRTNILNFITKGWKDLERLQRANHALHSFFARAAWPQAIKQNRVRDFDTSQPGQLCLPKVLARDAELKSCILSLEHMEEVTDLEVEDLSAGFPPNLLELNLSFEGCSNMSNNGLQALAKRLPGKVQVLKLDFLGCYNISNSGLVELAKSLPRNLRVLHLHFDNCEKIGLQGVKALAGSVNRGVLFKGTFKGTGVDRDFHSLAELKRECL